MEMHRLNDSERNVQPDAGHRSLNDRIAAILHPPVVAKAPVVTAAGDDAILGSPVATQEQCVRYLLSMNPSPELTVPPQELVAYYYEEGGREGIRPDVAFAQALKETGYFRYGGTVTPDQNNYCGLGTTSAAVKGAYFSSARLGVRARPAAQLGSAALRGRARGCAAASQRLPGLAALARWFATASARAGAAAPCGAPGARRSCRPGRVGA